MSCPHCAAVSPQGSLFCVACALPLGAASPPPMPLSAPPLKLVELENLQPTGRVLPLPGRDWAGTLYLGRPDLANGVVVDLDLAALDGHAKRVSRKQAQLHYVTTPGGGANEIRVADWASAHGTWLNKVRLGAGVSEPLHPGDELRFAELIFRVETA